MDAVSNPPVAPMLDDEPKDPCRREYRAQTLLQQVLDLPVDLRRKQEWLICAAKKKYNAFETKQNGLRTNRSGT